MLFSKKQFRLIKRLFCDFHCQSFYFTSREIINSNFFDRKLEIYVKENFSFDDFQRFFYVFIINPKYIVSNFHYDEKFSTLVFSINDYDFKFYFI